MAILVFANGEMTIGAWLRPYFERATAVIAADGGARHLFDLGHLPDVLIGDMDSLLPEQYLQLQESSTEIIIYPTAKDETDLELALLYAIQNYPPQPIFVFGADGGRLDHQLANILLLSHSALQDVPVQIVTESQRLWLVQKGHHLIEGQVGDTLSLLPLEATEVVTSRGLHWLLDQTVLPVGLPRGISNVFTESIAQIVISRGRMVCVHTWATAVP